MNLRAELAKKSALTRSENESNKSEREELRQEKIASEWHKIMF